MTKAELIEVRNVAFGLWSRSITGPDADNVTAAWGLALSRFPKAAVAQAIGRLAADKRRCRGDGTSPFPNVPEILQLLDGQRDRTWRPQLGAPDVSEREVAEMERNAAEAREAGRHATAGWYSQAADAYRAELEHRRAGGRPRIVRIDLPGVVRAAQIDNAAAGR